MLKYNTSENFKVEKGYLNRVKIYLYPAIVTLKSYSHLRNLKESFLCASLNPGKAIILYYDRSNTLAIKALINELKKNGEYINDYLYSPDVYAIEVDPGLNYNAFEEGTYTEIYPSMDMINKTFSSNSLTKKVLIKDPEYKQTFVDHLNKWFKTNYSIEKYERRDDGSRVEISQYDIPPCLNQEIDGYEREKLPTRADKLRKQTQVI